MTNIVCRIFRLTLRTNLSWFIKCQHYKLCKPSELPCIFTQAGQDVLHWQLTTCSSSNSKYISILSLGGGLPVREWIKPSFFQRSVDPHCAVSTSLSPVQTLLCTQLARKPFCPVALQRPRVWPGSKQDETNPRRTKAHQCTGASCYYMQAAERAGAALLCTRCACYLLLQVSTSMTESKVLPWTLPGSSYREQRMAHGCNTMNQKVHTESNKGEEAKIKINLKINFRTKLTVRAFYLSPSTCYAYISPWSLRRGDRG